MTPNTIDRAAAILIATTVAHIALGTSAVPLNLWVVSGGWAEIVSLVYATVLAAIAIDPDRPETHFAAAAAGALFWLGRMGGFLEIVIDQSRFDLTAAVHERAMVAGLIVLWHIRAVRKIAILQSLQLNRSDSWMT